MSAGRWAHLTYASFRIANGPSGWNIGPTLYADARDLDLVRGAAPTSLVPVDSFDDYISTADIDALPRRFEYRPMGRHALIMQSVPAGRDSTGRPGNVFTHAVIDRSPDEPSAVRYPIEMYRSEDLLVPFLAAEVNAVTLPEGAGEPGPGPMADLTVAWMMIDDMFGDRREALYELQDALERGDGPVVLVLKNSNEGAYWLHALSSTLTSAEARRLLHFSTFDRADTLPQHAGQRYSVHVASTQDREMLRENSGVHVVDPGATPAGASASGGSSEGHGAWARMTSVLFRGGFDADELVRDLEDANAAVAVEEIRGAQPGDGLARLILTAGTRHGAGAEAQAVARGHLETRRAEPVAHATVRSYTTAREEVQKKQLLDPVQVVSAPRIADSAMDYPVVGGLYAGEKLKERAIEAITRLEDSPVLDLIHYLDFLLRTELIGKTDIEDLGFRCRFAAFPALEQWRFAPLHRKSHELLRPLLEFAEQDSKVAVRNLALNRSVEEQIRWLQQPGARGMLSELSRTRFFRNRADKDYSSGLLCTFFTIAVSTEYSASITGEGKNDEEIGGDLADIAEDAVVSRLRSGAGRDRRKLIQVGAQSAAIWAASSKAERGAKAHLARIQFYRDEELSFLDREVREVFRTVAEGFLEEFERRMGMGRGPLHERHPGGRHRGNRRSKDLNRKDLR